MTPWFRLESTFGTASGEADWAEQTVRIGKGSPDLDDDAGLEVLQ